MPKLQDEYKRMPDYKRPSEVFEKQEQKEREYTHEQLSKIYEKGINRTWWKSTMLEKINDLRALLGFKAMEGDLTDRGYDDEVVDILKGINFSSLGGDSYIGYYYYNFVASVILNVAGYGLEPYSVQMIGQDAEQGGAQEDDLYDCAVPYNGIA